MGGGGAAELKELLDGQGERTLCDVSLQIGITAVTGADDAYLFPAESDLKRYRIEQGKTFLTGEDVRDWIADTQTARPPGAFWTASGTP
jgi:hypothetical protein